MDMMKKIKSVDLVRENCDVISVDVADIERVYLNNISSDTYIDSHGSYAKVQCADTVYIKLKPTANKEHYELECIDLEKAVFELLGMNDIAAVDMFFDDDTHEYVQVKWSADNSEINTYQHSYMDDDGNLYIGIGPYIDLKGFFNLYL